MFLVELTKNVRNVTELEINSYICRKVYKWYNMGNNNDIIQSFTHVGACSVSLVGKIQSAEWGKLT